MKKIKKRKKQKNSKQFNRQFKKKFFTKKSAIIIICTVVILGAFGIGYQKVEKKAAKYQKTIDELKTDVKNIEQTNKTLEKENKGIDTDEFKERIARERLGMIKEGEISLQEAKTDAKGRVFFPAVFRKQLQTAAEECLILRKDTYQDCLVLYPESVWNEQMNELRSKLNRWNSKHQMIFRQFVSDVEIITLDGNGRFLIPKRYLKLADIRQEVRFIGMDDTIEIWAKEIADKPFIAPEDFGKELEEIMGNNNNEGLE